MEYSDSIFSLIPILLTLTFSLWLRNVIIGLFIGVCTGVFMLKTGSISDISPLNTFSLMIKDYLVPQLTDSYNAGVLVLLVFISGFVALMEKSGGGHAFAKKVVNYLTAKGHAQIAAWFGGIIIFFSDLGTPLIVGPVFRSLFDKLKISREKLALILDSTSSPVAILIPFIGWGIYIMSLIKKEFDNLGKDINDLDTFVSAIPYQFYAILAISLVPVLAIKKLDFGPMARAEERVYKEGNKNNTKDDDLQLFTHEKARASFVWAPLLIMGIVFMALLIPEGFPFKKVSGSVFRAALSSAYFFAACTLMILMAIYGVRSLKESIKVYLLGMNNIMSVAIILILAWALSSIGKSLGTSEYISHLAESSFSPWILPAIIFLFSSLISFATGSSWGTFAIMFPLALPAAFSIDANLAACIGAVLSGGLFGDHSSPISETTILSSTGSGCEQIDHFKTQFPYALFNGAIAFTFFLLSGFISSSFLFIGALITQIILLYMLSLILNKSNNLS